MKTYTLHINIEKLKVNVAGNKGLPRGEISLAQLSEESRYTGLTVALLTLYLMHHIKHSSFTILDFYRLNSILSFLLWAHLIGAVLYSLLCNNASLVITHVISTVIIYLNGLLYSLIERLSMKNIELTHVPFLPLNLTSEEKLQHTSIYNALWKCIGFLRLCNIY